MWEDLKVYKQLDKKEINATFKKFGKEILSHLPNYTMVQTSVVIKLYRQVNQLELSIFIEKSPGNYSLTVKTCIKPVDFYRRHKFTMLNIVPLGDIMNNYRRSFYPLTQEWKELAFYLATRISNEIETYFQQYNSYNKIIDKRHEIEPKNQGLDNKYELLIYAAIKTKDQPLLIQYLDKKMSRPVMGITYTELLKPEEPEIDEGPFLDRIKQLAQVGDFEGIENEINGLFQ